MKIKSMVATAVIAASSGLYSASSLAQIPSIPVVGGLLSGGLGGGGIPVLGSLSGGGIPVIGSLTGGGIPIIGSLGDGGIPVLGSLLGSLTDGGIPVLGSLGGDGIPVVGSLLGGNLLDGLPLVGAGNFDGVIPELPGLGQLIDVSAIPVAVPELISDVTRSLGRNANAIPGLVTLLTQLNPLDAVGTLSGIGGNLGVGALFSTVPLVSVVVNDPSNIVEYILGDGTVLGQFGVLGTLPDIPLLTAPLGLGVAEGIPILGGLDGLGGLGN